VNGEISDRFRALASRRESLTGLAEGALVLAAEAQPGVDIDASLRRLGELVARGRSQVEAAASPARAVSALNHWLFEVEGFRGNQDQYDDLRNSFLDQVLVRRRLGAAAAAAIRRERRVLFDGVAAEIHPYDLTVEIPGRAEAWDCKWGARGINADVLNQLDDARRHAADEEAVIRVGLVVFDLRTSCAVRLAGQTAPKQGTVVVTMEALDALAGKKPR